jgi:hypothetical protein
MKTFRGRRCKAPRVVHLGTLETEWITSCPNGRTRSGNSPTVSAGTWIRFVQNVSSHFAGSSATPTDAVFMADWHTARPTVQMCKLALLTALRGYVTVHTPSPFRCSVEWEATIIMNDDLARVLEEAVIAYFMSVPGFYSRDWWKPGPSWESILPPGILTGDISNSYGVCSNSLLTVDLCSIKFHKYELERT